MKLSHISLKDKSQVGGYFVRSHKERALIQKDMEMKYKGGDMVYERMRPTKKLIVSRYKDGLYYCKAPDGLGLKELVFFERELKAGTNVTNNLFHG